MIGGGPFLVPPSPPPSLLSRESGGGRHFPGRFIFARELRGSSLHGRGGGEQHTHTHTGSTVSCRSVLKPAGRVFSTAPDKKNKQKRKNFEGYGEKTQIYFTDWICRVFIWQVFCKIDLKLDIISFLERLLKVCDSQNSQFFDPSSTVVYILYNCE